MWSLWSFGPIYLILSYLFFLFLLGCEAAGSFMYNILIITDDGIRDHQFGTKEDFEEGFTNLLAYCYYLDIEHVRQLAVMQYDVFKFYYLVKKDKVIPSIHNDQEEVKQLTSWFGFAKVRAKEIVKQKQEENIFPVSKEELDRLDGKELSLREEAWVNYQLRNK